MVMGAYARKHSRYHRSVECETDGALQILWNLWELHRFAKVLQICETGVMEKQETQRPNVLADVEEIYEYPKDTSTGVSKDISEKCVLGKWLIEEPYALIGHVRFCEGLLRLEPLIAKQYMMKGCEKVETKSTRRFFAWHVHICMVNRLKKRAMMCCKEFNHLMGSGIPDGKACIEKRLNSVRQNY